MLRAGLYLGLLAGGLFAATPLDQAQRLYDHTDYQGALKVLLAQSDRDGRAWALIGQSYFMPTDIVQVASRVVVVRRIDVGFGSDRAIVAVLRGYQKTFAVSPLDAALQRMLARASWKSRYSLR